MSLSSNSIIHFTNTKDYLKGILSNNFKIKYCRESVNFTGDSISYFVPMVSFCDIPLSEVKNHISKYGPYGIGLTKEWAEKNRLNPVIYLDKKSNLANSYWKVYEKYIIHTHVKSDFNWMHLDEAEIAIIDLLRYMKNYQDNLVRGGEVSPNYRFSDEREWRYVPDFSNDFLMTFDARNISEEIKQQYNDKLSHLVLEFEPNDIKYVIIEKDDDIPEFLELFRNSKGKYSYSDVERLMTRLITTEQIISDF